MRFVAAMWPWLSFRSGSSSGCGSGSGIGSGSSGPCLALLLGQPLCAVVQAALCACYAAVAHATRALCALVRAMRLLLCSWPFGLAWHGLVLARLTYLPYRTTPHGSSWLVRLLGLAFKLWLGSILAWLTHPPYCTTPHGFSMLVRLLGLAFCLWLGLAFRV